MGKFNMEFWRNKEFWKDAATMAMLAAAIYVVHVIVTYWPEITEGFNRGWNSR